MGTGAQRRAGMSGARSWLLGQRPDLGRSLQSSGRVCRREGRVGLSTKTLSPEWPALGGRAGRAPPHPVRLPRSSAWGLRPGLPFACFLEERGRPLPPAVAHHERGPGPAAAGAAGPPDSRPHEGREAPHHRPPRLGQRVSTARRGLGGRARPGDARGLSAVPSGPAVGAPQSMTRSQASGSHVFCRNRCFQIAFRVDLCVPFYRVPPPCCAHRSPVSSGGVAWATALVTAHGHRWAPPRCQAVLCVCISLLEGLLDRM